MRYHKQVAKKRFPFFQDLGFRKWDAPHPGPPVLKSPQTSPPAGAKTAAAPARKAYTLPHLAAKAWTGDLDGMIKRRMIRVLVPYSKTLYFVDRGTQRGLLYEMFRLFADDFNKKLKKKRIRVQVFFMPNGPLTPISGSTMSKSSPPKRSAVKRSSTSAISTNTSWPTRRSRSSVRRTRRPKIR